MSRRRNRDSRKRCKNCPDAVPPVGSQTPAIIAANNAALKMALRPIAEGTEGTKLWHHLLFGTGTLIGMMDGYADAGLPGGPVDQVNQLIQRLVQVAQKLATTNETRDSKALVPDDPARD